MVGRVGFRWSKSCFSTFTPQIRKQQQQIRKSQKPKLNHNKIRKSTISSVKEYSTMGEQVKHILGGHDSHLNSNDLYFGSSQYLDKYQLYKWQPDPNLSPDENYMDLTMLVTRNSICRQGCMACVLVNPNQPLPMSQSHRQEQTDTVGSMHELSSNVTTCSTASNNETSSPSSSTTATKPTTTNAALQTQEAYRKRFFKQIIGASTNLPLFSKADSDIHAEIAALGQCNQCPSAPSSSSTSNTSTKNAIAYITMPPCKNCFGALVTAGIKKIVTQQRYSDVLTTTANNLGIELVDMGIEYKAQQRIRVDQLMKDSMNINNINNDNDERLEIVRLRKKRKEERLAQKQAKKERREKMKEIHQKSVSGK